MYKIEKILTITGLVGTALSAIANYWTGDKQLAFAWTVASLWCFNSLTNLINSNQSKS